MPPVEFEPTISAGERLQTYALDRTATGTGYKGIIRIKKFDRKGFLHFYYFTHQDYVNNDQ